MQRRQLKPLSRVLALFMLAYSPLACAYSSVAQDQDRSFYLGEPATHPENLSGIWQSPDGHGGAIALVLTLTTNAPSNAKTIDRTPQTWLSLAAALSHIQNGALTWMDGESFSFSDSERGRNLHYDNGHLMVHYGRLVNFDLVHNSHDQWVGYLRQPGFSGNIVLKRPGIRAAKASRLQGTWKSGNGPNPTCLHIAAEASGKYLAWYDNLQVLGLAKFGPNLTRPALVPQFYGMT